MKKLPDNLKMNENQFFLGSNDHIVAAFASRLLVTGSLCKVRVLKYLSLVSPIWILDWIRLRGDKVKRRPV